MNKEQEEYLPSIHLKNIAPTEWLRSEEGREFLEKLEEFQSGKKMVESQIEWLSDFHSPITENLVKIHNYLHKINDEVM